MTQLMRDKLSEAVKEFDAIIKPGGGITYLGTPQTEQSLYNLLPERGYQTRIWPARFPANLGHDIYGEHLAPIIINSLENGTAREGDPTDPQRFNATDLMEREASYGRSGFALQFMLDTRLADADRYPLKLSDLIVMDLSPHEAPEKVVWGRGQENVIEGLVCVGLNGDRYYQPMYKSPDWIEYKGSILAIDPSGRGKDETAYAVVKMLNGQLFVTAAGGIQGGYDDNVLTTLSNLARDQKVNKIIVESNFGDGMFTQLLKPYLARIYPVTIEEVRHNIQKEKRIVDCLEPVMNQHKLVVDRQLIEADYKSTLNLPPEIALRYQLFYQMSRITRDRGALTQDDRLDALAIAVNYWTERMAQDVDKAVQSRKDNLLDKELAVFMGHATDGIYDLACLVGTGGLEGDIGGENGGWIALDF